MTHDYNPRCLCTPCLDRTVQRAETMLDALLATPEGQAAAERLEKEMMEDES